MKTRLALVGLALFVMLSPCASLQAAGAPIPVFTVTTTESLNAAGVKLLPARYLVAIDPDRCLAFFLGLKYAAQLAADWRKTTSTHRLAQISALCGLRRGGGTTDSSIAFFASTEDVKSVILLLTQTRFIDSQPFTESFALVLQH